MEAKAVADEKRPAVKLIGMDGNALSVVGLCRRAAKAAGWTTERWDAVREEMLSGDYNKVLQTAMRHFDVR